MVEDDLWMPKVLYPFCGVLWRDGGGRYRMYVLYSFLKLLPGGIKEGDIVYLCYV